MIEGGFPSTRLNGKVWVRWYWIIVSAVLGIITGSFVVLGIIAK
jgi:hypothetical protein